MPSLFTKAQRAAQLLRSHGPRLFFHRYLTRPRILSTSPIPCPPDATLEVHMQICRRDWLNGLWTLRSLAFHAATPFRLVLLHDGSPPPAALDHYRRLFPGTITAAPADADPAIADLLSSIAPSLLSLWQSRRYFTLPKVLSSAVLATSPRPLQLDPDVFFFARPDHLLQAVADPTTTAVWNVPRDKGHADGMFCFQPDLIESACGLRPPVPFQVGIGAWTPALMPWQAAGSLLSSHTPPDEFIFMLDQTLLALHAAANGWQPLPSPAYAIDPVTSLDGIIARHYFGKTRDLMYIEAIATAHRTLL